MHDAAKVTSIDALKDFKGALLEFGELAQSSMLEVDSEINRTMNWLQREQINYWQGQLRRRTELLGRAKSELYRKELSKTATGEKPSTVDQKKAVQKAKHMLDEAHDKIEKVKRWQRTIEREMNLYRGQVSQLSRAVESDLPRYVAMMTRMLDSLDAYVSLAPPEVTAPPTAGAAAGIPGEKATTVSRATPVESATAVERLVRALRARAPRRAERVRLPRRATLEGEPDSAPVAPPSAAVAGTARPVRDEELIVVEDGPVGTRLVLDRLADPPQDDSGWTLARAEESAGASSFVCVTAGELLRLRPALRDILSLPPGTAVVVSPAGTDVLESASE